MTFKTILKAAAAAALFTIGAAGAADAMPYHGRPMPHPVARHEVRRVVDHRVVFASMHARHMRYIGTPHFVRGHYVIRSFDRFGRVAFVEINPYTGAVIGFFRI
ncbi:MAG: hypothetical protein JSR60_14945 [Proteobacteria bacterium]|nr:hypothetical protein [Pseudomonadota bacterium]